MKLWDIISKVGGAAVKAFVPGGGLIVDAVNEFLPGDKKLPSDATGDQMRDAVDSLPADKRAELLGREFDVQIEAHHTVQAMLAADAQSTHTTRPGIALMAAKTTAFVNILAISIWAWAVITSADPLESVVNGWPFIVAVTGTFTTLLLAYFGILRQEHKNRLDASTGNSTTGGIGGILSAILTRKR